LRGILGFKKKPVRQRPPRLVQVKKKRGEPGFWAENSVKGQRRQLAKRQKGGNGAHKEGGFGEGTGTLMGNTEQGEGGVDHDQGEGDGR